VRRAIYVFLPCIAFASAPQVQAAGACGDRTYYGYLPPGCQASSTQGNGAGSQSVPTSGNARAGSGGTGSSLGADTGAGAGTRVAPGATPQTPPATVQTSNATSSTPSPRPRYTPPAKPAPSSSGGHHSGMSAGEIAVIVGGVITVGALIATAVASHKSEASAPAAVEPPPLRPGSDVANQGEPATPATVAPVPRGSPYADAPRPSESWAVVPPLVGLTVGSAMKALELSGLDIAIDQADDGTEHANRITAQSIAPQTRAPVHSTVMVTLAPASAPTPSIQSITKMPPILKKTRPLGPPPMQKGPMVQPGSEVAASDNKATGASATEDKPPSAPTTVDNPRPSVPWVTVSLMVAALLALAVAAYELLKKLLLPPPARYRIRVCGDPGKQSCRMPNHSMFYPAVNVRLASEPWEAHVSQRSGQRAANNRANHG
jgi:hypothetical protein